ncbi:MAG: hypothetical protein JXR12_01375 [Neptunomonas phycophila]|uniref:hypothetical protein n=1 Tax=Neptunomonas phycophila TaxID=1572645 RepID=UPI003B8B3B28
MNDDLSTRVIGHCVVKEHDRIGDEGRVLLDQTNAVHPQNMARIFARALANESNYFIHRIAFGNGGTDIDVASNIIYNTPRDGLNPGDNYWEARLYNETYAEIVDDSNLNIGSGPGSNPTGDPDTIEHVSGPGVRSVEDLTVGSTVSSVVINAVINPDEPGGQSDSQEGGIEGENNLNSDFTFDEMGLFTAGSPQTNTSGYQDVNVGGKESKHDTGLAPNQAYSFAIEIDGGTPVNISFTTPTVGTGDGVSAPLNAITYGDLVTVLNIPGGDLDSAGARALITDDIASQDGGVETYGFLRFESYSSGSISRITLTDTTLFAALTGFLSLETPANGTNAGVRNDPLTPDNERERLLTHLVFSPVTKTADRVLSITYTLNIVVARTIKK